MGNDRLQGSLLTLIYGLCAVVMVWRVSEFILPRVNSWRARRATAAYLEMHGTDLFRAESAIAYGGGTDTVTLFTDYECPGCRYQDNSLERVNGAGLVVSYRQLPIPSLHPHAIHAARIAVCASLEGQFPRAHRALMTGSDWKDAVKVLPWLEEFGFSRDQVERIRSCLATSEADSVIAEDRALASRLGINGTPGWVFRDSVHIGVLSTGSR